LFFDDLRHLHGDSAALAVSIVRASVEEVQKVQAPNRLKRPKLDEVDGLNDLNSLTA
jgi:hypothetical protein